MSFLIVHKKCVGLLIAMAFLSLGACAARKKSDPEPPQVQDSTLKPYHSSSTTAEALTGCIQKKCTLRAIGDVYSSPTLDNILDRLLVEKPEYGQHFDEFFKKIPKEVLEDFLILFKTVRVIIIAEGDSNEGGFVIGDFLNLNSVLFTKNGSFLLAANEVDNGKLPVVYGDFFVKDGRRMASDKPNDLSNQLSIAHVLYHELAHAADNPGPHAMSEALKGSNFQAESPILHNLALHMYGKKKITTNADHYISENISKAFEQAKGVSLYSFVNSQEDLATTFEKFMLLNRFGMEWVIVLADSKVMQLPMADRPISWGEKNSVLSERMQPKVKFILQKILPGRILSETLPFSYSRLEGGKTIEQIFTPGSV